MSGGVLLISQRVKEQNLLSFLHEFRVKKFFAETASPVGPDIIFPECQPSLAAISLDFRTEQRPLSTIIEQIESVQGKFKNSYALCIDCDADRWLQLQLTLTSGSLRLLRVTSAAEGGRHLLEIYKALKDTEKLKMQRNYFEQEEKNLVSQKTAIGIASSTFRNLGIPDQDGSLIMDAFTSLKAIITASQEDLSSNSPADQQSIDKLVNFFSASHF